MPDRPDHRPDGSGLPGNALPEPLARALARIPAPDPGDAYFATLADRTRARLDAPAMRRQVAPARPPAAPARPPAAPARPPAAPACPPAARGRTQVRRGASVLAAALVLLGLWATLRRAPDTTAPRPAVAQQRPAAPERPDSVRVSVPVPASVPTAVPNEAPRVDGPRPVAPRHRPVPTAVPPPRSAAPLSAPRRTQRLAAAPLDSVRTDEAVPARVDLDGLRLLRRAHVVMLALQHAETDAEVEMLAPLAAPLATDLARWRLAPDADLALVAAAGPLEPMLAGLALLPPSDVASARALRTAARRADLSLLLDRALLASDGAHGGAY